MSEYNVIGDFVRGVDMRVNPLSLGTTKFHYAKNMIFDEGIPRTRYGYDYQPLGVSGEFQEGIFHNGGRSVSSTQYGKDQSTYVMVVGGKAYASAIGASFTFEEIADLGYEGDVYLESAENYVIFQNRCANTFWWDGCVATESEGMYHCAEAEDDRCYTEDLNKYDKQYATFINDNIKDWLINEAGHVIYAHGRVHQEYGHIWASDIINKRGAACSDDILKQTESARWSFGDPVTAPSFMGSMTAIVTYPSKGNSSHDGDILAFYEVGSQFIDTNQFPRQTRADAKGTIIQQGWNYKKLTKPATHEISATGKRSAVTTPTDVFFASAYGAHFVSSVAGQGSFNDETTRIISSDVDPIFLSDTECLLHGRQVGHWIEGSRFFIGGCLEQTEHGVLPIAKGMMSMSQNITYTEDGSAIPTWEGFHTVDEGIAGIHKFERMSLGNERGQYGFISSDMDSNLYWAKIDKDRHMDKRGADYHKIPWEAVTGRFRPSGTNYASSLDGGVIRVRVSNLSESLKVEVRTDSNSEWSIMKEVSFEQSLTKCYYEESIPLNQPAKASREAVWYEMRISGVGYVELQNITLEITKGDKLESKKKRSKSRSRTYDWKENL